MTSTQRARFQHPAAATAKTHANAVLNTNNQRQGNCTNSSFGSEFHTGRLAGSIRKPDTPARTSNTHQKSLRLNFVEWRKIVECRKISRAITRITNCTVAVMETT